MFIIFANDLHGNYSLVKVLLTPERCLEKAVLFATALQKRTQYWAYEVHDNHNFPVLKCTPIKSV